MDRLTQDQLAQVLSHVDIRHRLSACSLVSNTWRAAAATATSSVLTYRASPAFAQWLRSHSAEVQVTSLTASTGDRHTQIGLPLAQLQSLQCLELSNLAWSPGPEAAYTAAQPSRQPCDKPASGSSSSSKPRGLEPLTALTKLSLRGTSVRLAGLETLTGLQVLSCMRNKTVSGLQSSDSLGDPEFTAAQEDLAAAFPQLQRLTNLSLEGDLASAAVVARLGCLQSLRYLELQDTAALGFEALPTGLTQLNLRLKRPSTIGNAALLSQLTGVQVLLLRNARELDLSLLAGMCGLRHLRLSDVAYAAGSPNLQLLSRFTALTSLNIGGLNDRVYGTRPSASITAAEVPALTSSSQLASLMLSEAPGQLRPQDYAALFPPGRSLQHLTMLCIGSDLLSDTAAVRQAGTCATNLHTVHVAWPQPCSWDIAPAFAMAWEDGEAERVAASLQILSEWQQLRSLSLIARGMRFPKCIWEALGTLSHITRRHVNCMPVPGVGLPGGHVLSLAGCRALQDLSVHAEGYGIFWMVDYRSTVRPWANPGPRRSLSG